MPQPPTLPFSMHGTLPHSLPRPPTFPFGMQGTLRRKASKPLSSWHSAGSCRSMPSTAVSRTLGSRPGSTGSTCARYACRAARTRQWRRMGGYVSRGRRGLELPSRDVFAPRPTEKKKKKKQGCEGLCRASR